MHQHHHGNHHHHISNFETLCLYVTVNSIKRSASLLRACEHKKEYIRDIDDDDDDDDGIYEATHFIRTRKPTLFLMVRRLL